MASYLTTSQYKLDKSKARGWKTVGLNLSPATEAGLVLGKTLPTMCAMAGTCADVCLAKTGMNVFPASVKARARRTQEYMTDYKGFVAKVDKEIKALAKTHKKLAVRPNLLSDRPGLAHSLANLNPTVQFYDYTKLPVPRRRVLDNYHLTYSVSEKTTKADLAHCLQFGINMAVVFNVRRDGKLPAKLKVQGKWLRVVDGDKDDLRFLDPEGVVVGLRWKGSNARMAEGVKGGFVHDAKTELVR
jgi:hypothetical protein